LVGPKGTNGARWIGTSRVQVEWRRSAAISSGLVR
jgi:hypothetical protein